MKMRKRAVPPPANLQVQLSQPSDLLSPQDLIPHDLRPFRSAALLLQMVSENGKTNEEQRFHETNYSSKQSDTGAVAEDDIGVVKVQIPLPPSNQTTEGVGVTTPPATTEGRWCEREKAIPLKKRKMSLEMNGVVTGENKCKMKSMTNTKFPLKDQDDDYEEDDNSSSDSYSKKVKTKKKKKRRKMGKKGGNGRIMEGSRCSRVNGRGWRCMQPTLVGYSLCDHHLGKGRLRSINSTSRRLPPVTTATQELSKFIQDDDDNNSDADEGKKKKRKRIGMVKARSLSSLLCQPNTAFEPSSSIYLNQINQLPTHPI